MEYNGLRSFYVSKFCQNAGTRACLTLYGFLQRSAVYLKSVSEAVNIKDEERRAPESDKATLTTCTVIEMLQPSV